MVYNSEFDEYFEYFTEYNNLRNELINIINSCNSLEMKFTEINKFMKKIEEERYGLYQEIKEKIDEYEMAGNYDRPYYYAPNDTIREYYAHEYIISRIKLREDLEQIIFELNGATEEETINYAMECVKPTIFKQLFSWQYFEFLHDYGYEEYKVPYNFGIPTKFKVESCTINDKKSILSDISTELESNKSRINNLVVDKVLFYNIQGDTEKVREKVTGKYLECVKELEGISEYNNNKSIELGLGIVYSWIYRNLDEVKDFTDFIIFENILSVVISVFDRYINKDRSNLSVQNESDYPVPVNPFSDFENSNNDTSVTSFVSNPDDVDDDFLKDIVNPFKD